MCIEVGLSLVSDYSGKCFQRAGTKRVSLKDVASNGEAIFYFGYISWSQVVAAVLRASKGRGYFSKHLMDQAVRLFYNECELWPDGLREDLPAVREWSARMGVAIARLAPRSFESSCMLRVCLAEAARFRPLAMRSNTSKQAGLQWIRDQIHGYVDAGLAL